MKRAVLPIVLALFGATLLIGCFYIPVSPQVTASTPNTASSIFDAVGAGSSKKWLRVGAATRAQVLRVAPYPRLASTDGQVLIYSDEGIDGYWVYPLCFNVETDSTPVYLRLKFDDAGILLSYSVHTSEFAPENGVKMVASYDDVSDRPRNPWPPALPAEKRDNGP